MLFLGPYYGSDSEHCKYAPVFFDSLSYPSRQTRQLHDEISGEGLGYHEIMERAKDMFNL